MEENLNIQIKFRKILKKKWNIYEQNKNKKIRKNKKL